MAKLELYCVHEVFDRSPDTSFLDTIHIRGSHHTREKGVFRKAFETLYTHALVSRGSSNLKFDSLALPMGSVSTC